MRCKKTVFWESNPFSDVDSVITLPNDFKDCKIICISLSKSGRLSNPYIMYKGNYGNLVIDIPYIVAFGIKQ